MVPKLCLQSRTDINAEHCRCLNFQNCESEDFKQTLVAIVERKLTYMLICFISLLLNADHISKQIAKYMNHNKCDRQVTFFTLKFYNIYLEVHRPV